MLVSASNAKKPLKFSQGQSLATLATGLCYKSLAAQVILLAWDMVAYTSVRNEHRRGTTLVQFRAFFVTCVDLYTSFSCQVKILARRLSTGKFHLP